MELWEFSAGYFDFLIVAFAVFMVIKAINATKKKDEAAPRLLLLLQKRKFFLLRSGIC